MVMVPGDVQDKLLGQNDMTIQMIEERYPLEMSLRGETLVLRSPDLAPLRTGARLVTELVKLAKKGVRITQEEIRYGMDCLAESDVLDLLGLHENTLCFTSRGKPVRTRTMGQKRYMEAVSHNHVVFCIGPAGTGKTYLAVAQAVAMLKSQQVSRVILVRPAVEAGESLGYLPGDLKEKIEPYLRPLYDAFFDLLSPERFMRYVEKNIIEIAPLAYMRGRTLNDSFIILDEAQNTTPEQMKMFLTRMGFGSRVVVTGDITQVDLPSGRLSGLRTIQEILQGIQGIAFVTLNNNDVVRHEIVQKIVQAYEEFEKKQ